MLSRRNLISLIAPLIMLMSLSVQALAGTSPRLDKLPVGERWFGIFFNDERAGFSHDRTREEKAGYELQSESCVKMSSFAFSRNASTRETYVVNPDLSLRTFAVDQTIDGKHMIVKGEAFASGIKSVVDYAGHKKEKLLKNKEAVYPPMVMNLIPLFKGAEPGKVYRVSMLDPEAVKIKKVEITVVGPEKAGSMNVLHIRNDLYPVDNDIWVDYQGNTIKESVRDGWIVTQSEDEKVIRKFIAESALEKKDFIMDFSRAGIGGTIAKPSEVRKMVVELSGLPSDLRIPTGSAQIAEKIEERKMIVTVDNSLLGSKAAALSNADRTNYLKQAGQLPPDNPALLAKKAEIVGKEENPEKVIEKLAFWVAAHVKDTATASESPLDTIHKGEGDCLAHARLYAALARAAGIPTKIELGLAYIRDRGFLYHCWAESYSDRWLPVDPTSGEVPANATHMKLVEGDTPEDLAALSEFVGKIKTKLLEYK